MNEILIYDDIGADLFGDGVTAKTIHDQLKDLTGDLTVRINSYGGDVFEGHAIYNLLKNYEGLINVKIDGLAASAASVIAMAGDTVEMPVNGLLMIHDPYTMALGDAEEMRKTAEVLDDIKESIVAVYKEKTGMEEDILASMMKVETWLKPEQAIAMGFANEVNGEANINNSSKRAWINKTPKTEEVIENKETGKTEETIKTGKTEYPNIAARTRYLEIEAEAC